MQIVSVSSQKYSEHITQNSFRIRVEQGRKLFPAPLTLFLALHSKPGTVRKCRELAVSVRFLRLNAKEADRKKEGLKKKTKPGAVSPFKVPNSPIQMCSATCWKRMVQGLPLKIIFLSQGRTGEK